MAKIASSERRRQHAKAARRSRIQPVVARKVTASTIAAHHRSFKTDPKRTKNLWAQVMGPKQQKYKSQIPAPVGSESGSQTLRSRSQTATSVITNCPPGSPDFDACVLAPRGIILHRSVQFVTPHFHFETEPLQTTDELRTPYKILPELQNTTIWIERRMPFLERVKKEYFCMTYNSEPEAEFQDFALGNLLRRECREIELPETRTFLPERLLQTILKCALSDPNEFWVMPPVTQPATPQRPYNFDIRPDCTYWISLQPFSSKYRFTVQSVVALHSQDRLLCPYLTIEFKRDTTADTKAEQQVAVAGSLALYNRWSLRKRRLSKCDASYSAEESWRHIRHYGVTFGGPKYKVWCLEPTHSSDETWQGCRMKLLSAGSCANHTSDVLNLVDWLNEIHRWGISVHGPECEKDVKVLIHASEGGPRTSLSTEEIANLRLD